MIEIPGYITERSLGEGGMGSVFLANQVKLNRQVAVKVLLPHLAQNPDVVKRFHNEAQLMAQLNHANIVQLYDFLELPNGLALVMEFVQGQTLDNLIGRVVGPIPHERAIPMFRQVLDGVAYAHKKGIIHRDLKPSNVLVTADGLVKITDFGIAKIAGVEGVTRTGVFVGTYYYASPEQIKQLDLTFASDVYSLGMLLYVMLAGQSPFEKLTSEYEITERIIAKPLPDPRTFYPHIPEQLVSILFRALEKDVDARYSSCDEFFNALLRVSSIGGGVTARNISKLDSSNTDAHAWFVKGCDFQQSGNTDQAIECFNQALKRDMNSAYAFFSRGKAYDSKQLVEQAMEDFDKAIALDANIPDAYYYRALLHLKNEQIEKAIKDLEQAVRLNDGNVSYFVLLAKLHFQSGEHTDARINLDKALSIEPDMPDALIDRGTMLSESGQIEKAIVDFDRSIQLDPHNMHAYLIRGEAYQKMELWDLANSDFDIVKKSGINLSSVDRLKLHRLRGEMYQHKGALEQALVEYNSALDIDEDDVATLTSRSMVFTTLRKWDKALADLYRLNTLCPNTKDVQIAIIWRNKAEALLSGNYSPLQAIPVLEKAIAHDPTEIEHYWLLGECYLKTDNQALAEATFQQALDLSPEGVLRYSLIKAKHTLIYNTFRALGLFSKIIQDYPDSVEAYWGRANAYSRLGKHSEAISDYETIIKLVPENAEAHYELSVSYLSLGNTAVASSHMLEAKRLGHPQTRTMNRLISPQEVSDDNVENQPLSPILPSQPKKTGCLGLLLLPFILLLVIFYAGCTATRTSSSTSGKQTFTESVDVPLGKRESQEDVEQYALADCKRKVLERVGVYLESQTDFKRRIQEAQGLFAEDTDQQCRTLTISSGITETEIVKQGWSNRNAVMIYSLTCRVTVDPKDVQKRLDNLLADRKRAADEYAVIAERTRITRETAETRSQLEQAPPETKDQQRQKLKQLTDGQKATQLFEQAIRSFTLDGKIDLLMEALTLAPNWSYLLNTCLDISRSPGLPPQLRGQLERLLQMRDHDPRVAEELYQQAIKCLTNLDINGAVQLLQQAAELGHPDAQKKLRSLQSGEQGQVNPFNWFK